MFKLNTGQTAPQESEHFSVNDTEKSPTSLCYSTELSIGEQTFLNELNKILEDELACNAPSPIPLPSWALDFSYSPYFSAEDNLYSEESSLPIQEDNDLNREEDCSSVTEVATPCSNESCELGATGPTFEVTGKSETLNLNSRLFFPTPLPSPSSGKCEITDRFCKQVCDPVYGDPICGNFIRFSPSPACIGSMYMSYLHGCTGIVRDNTFAAKIRPSEGYKLFNN